MYLLLLPWDHKIICLPNKCIKRWIRFHQIWIYVTLLCIGQILSVLFKYLSCRNISRNDENSHWVQFYFGDTECFGHIWIISLVTLLIFIMLFTLSYIYMCFYG